MLEALPMSFAVCQTADFSQVDFDDAYCFAARTEDEWSLVCRESRLPANCLRCERGWRGLRIRGTLDFSLVGVLSSLAGLLAARGVSLFAVSTYNTDYLFVHRAQYPAALSALREGGYPVEEPARYEEEEAPICPQP